MTYRTGREHFDRLVEQALEGLPAEFRKRFKNMTISVEDYPSAEDIDDISVRGLSRNDILGIFRGVGYPHKGDFFDMSAPLPDEIVLFQRNIESICITEADLIEEIGLTLVHEVGHYFGLSEEELRKYEP